MNQPADEREIRRLRATEADCFVHAMEHTMSRKGQGVHLSQSVLELDGIPDRQHLQTELDQLLTRHRMLTCKLNNPFPGTAPRFEPHQSPATKMKLRAWKEGEPEDSTGFDPIESLDHLVRERLNANESALGENGYCNICFDLVVTQAGPILLLMTWRHIILDGIGAELLLQDLANPEIKLESVKWDQKIPTLKFVELWKRTSPVVTYMYRLMEHRYRSLSGAKQKSCGVMAYRITFTEEETEIIDRKSSEVCGPLIQTPFFVACATRAHHRVFQMRGELPGSYMVNVPSQARKRSATGGPIFQNFVSMVLFSAKPQEVGDFDALVQHFKNQQSHFLKEKLGASFDDLMRLMRRVPSWFYISFIRLQMRGEMNTFYHGMTAEFAPNLKEFFGTKVTGAWHMPTVYQPPGTGIFLNRKMGRLTLSLADRDNVVTDDERKTMIQSMREDLLG